VSGTENQHTANDYSKRLSTGILMLTENVLPKVLLNSTLDQLNGASVSFCQLLNISECRPIENQNNFTMIIYNPLTRKIRHWFRVPLVTSDYKINKINMDGSLTPIDFEIVSIYDETK
jgi:hypothetical protein